MLDMLHQSEGEAMSGRLNRFAWLLPKDTGAEFKPGESGEKKNYSRVSHLVERERRSNSKMLQLCKFPF